MRILFVISSLVGLVAITPSMGETPLNTAFTYQGQLKDVGVPVTGTMAMTFQLFDAAAAGASVGGPIAHPSVAVSNGLFEVELNFGLAAFDGNERYLQVVVEGVPLSPRQRIAAAPYALHALNVPSIKESNWRNNGDDVFVPAGNVGIGVDEPEALLHLRRPLAATALRFQTVRFTGGPPANLVRTPGLSLASGDGQTWTSPGSARISDDVRATTNFSAAVGSPDADQSQPLSLTNCGFALPGQAVVVGIQVGIEGQGSCSCTDCDVCTTRLGVELLGGSGPAGFAPISMTPSESTVNVGGTFELWDLDWSAGQVNDPGFGVRLTGSLALLNTFICFPGLGCSYVACDCTGSGSVGVDAMTVTVFFYDTSVTSTPVDWTIGIPETGSGLQVSPTVDLTHPAINVDPAGYVGINTPATAPYHLALVGFAAKSTGSQWTTLSDRRLKRNIEPLSGALARLLSLRGVTFEFTKEGIATRLAEEGRHTGFVAQDVEEVFPEWVSESGNGYKFVTENGTTALLVEALRELRAEKDAQIAELMKRLSLVEAQIQIGREHKGD